MHYLLRTGSARPPRQPSAGRPRRPRTAGPVGSSAPLCTRGAMTNIVLWSPHQRMSVDPPRTYAHQCAVPSPHEWPHTPVITPRDGGGLLAAGAVSVTGAGGPPGTSWWTVFPAQGSPLLSAAW